MKFRIFFHHFLIFAGCLSFIGCASTASLQFKTTLAPAAAKNVSVKIDSFVDERSEPERGVIGGVYNGYNMRMGDVKEPVDLVATMMEAVRSEVKNAGYRISDNAQDLVVRGFVKLVACDSGNGKTSQLTLRLVVEDKGQEILNKIYHEQSSNRFTLTLNCGPVLTESLQKIASQFVQDLNEYIKT